MLYDVYFITVKKQYSQVWLLKPIILVTQESEIGRIMGQGHPGQKILKTSSQSMAGHNVALPAWGCPHRSIPITAQA
jgi:hypothetical protein